MNRILLGHPSMEAMTALITAVTALIVAVTALYHAIRP